jgi:superfamily II DNA/RNA helicase
MQAEMVFQELWRINDDGLAIALHHGSLDVAQRRKVEDAMAAGRLRAVVCTSSLDLGIDWGDIDLVVNVGAPKGASRMLQRIGRANHRLDEPSEAVLVPANRFEVLECRAAIEAIAEYAQDTPPMRRRARRAGAARARQRGRRAVPPGRALRGGEIRRALRWADPHRFRRGRRLRRDRWLRAARL